MGLSLEVSAASCEALDALPHAGIGSTDLVPPGGLMSSGVLASVVCVVTVRRDFGLPPSGRLVPTALLLRFCPSLPHHLLALTASS